ncbi:MAG: hypothetical protein LPK85_07245, partial [Gammaproteobacteria bacterium]|nr:hypothetical protein [Gammaproteobacteria bacterium]
MGERTFHFVGDLPGTAPVVQNGRRLVSEGMARIIGATSPSFQEAGRSFPFVARGAGRYIPGGR